LAGHHAAALLDRQVVDWLNAMFGSPKSASGTLVSGVSMGNIIAVAVGRVDVRELGVAGIPKPLAFYGSDQIHSYHRKAREALGLGNRAPRRITTDRSVRIDLAALEAAIAADRAEGSEPACVIATAARSTRALSTISRRSPCLPNAKTSGCISTAPSARCSPSRPRMLGESRGS
jgi:aromatic-L-amino-acid/L-tryptophan decarboxylase